MRNHYLYSLGLLLLQGATMNCVSSPLNGETDRSLTEKSVPSPGVMEVDQINQAGSLEIWSQNVNCRTEPDITRPPRFASDISAVDLGSSAWNDYKPSISGYQTGSNWVAVIKGDFFARSPGAYEFRLSLGNADNARVNIAGQDVITPSRRCAWTEQRDGIIELDAGSHPVVIIFWDDGWTDRLTLEVRSPEAEDFEVVTFDQIPDTWPCGEETHSGPGTCDGGTGPGPFVVPFDSRVFIKAVGGEAGALTNFGVGATPESFVGMISGLPSNPSTSEEVLVGTFEQGEEIPFAMTTEWAGSHFATTNGVDEASRTAFADLDNSLGWGGQTIQETGVNLFVMHLDDAASHTADDDDNDVLIQIRLEEIVDGGHGNDPPDPMNSLRIRNSIDGRSRMVIQAHSARYHHLDFAAPGRHCHNSSCMNPLGDCAGPGDPTIINGSRWFPDWPESGENRVFGVESSALVSSVPLIPQNASSLSLNVIEGRGDVRLIETPTRENDFSLIIEWDDNALGGCSWYEVEILFDGTPTRCGDDADGVCPSDCTAVEDSDCAVCGDGTDGVCPSACTVVEDSDCAVCGDGTDGICPPDCAVRQDRDCSTLEPSTCAAKYDPDEVCEETATSCTFYKLLNSESCSSYCQERGGTCIDAFADARGGCARLHDSHCDDPVSDNICVCSIANTPVVNPANGHEYYLLGISSWTDAEEQAIALGGHLVTIDNQAENDWVLQTFSSYIPVQPCTGLWIGLTDSNGEVLWVSGDAVTYTNWNDGEPNSQSEDYANMLVQGRPSDGYWNDLPNSGYGCIYGVAEVIPQ